MLLFLLSNSIILPFYFQSPLFLSLFLILVIPQPLAVSLFPSSFALYHNLHFAFIRSGDGTPLSPARSALARSLVLQLRVVAPDLGLELDELFGDFVVGPLGQYSQDGQSRLVHVDAAAERQPTRARALQRKRSDHPQRATDTAEQLRSLGYQS